MSATPRRGLSLRDVDCRSAVPCQSGDVLGRKHGRAEESTEESFCSDTDSDDTCAWLSDVEDADNRAYASRRRDRCKRRSATRSGTSRKPTYERDAIVARPARDPDLESGYETPTDVRSPPSPMQPEWRKEQARHEFITDPDSPPSSPTPRASKPCRSTIRRPCLAPVGLRDDKAEATSELASPRVHRALLGSSQIVTICEAPRIPSDVASASPLRFDSEVDEYDRSGEEHNDDPRPRSGPLRLSCSPSPRVCRLGQMVSVELNRPIHQPGRAPSPGGIRESDGLLATAASKGPTPFATSSRKRTSASGHAYDADPPGLQNTTMAKKLRLAKSSKLIGARVTPKAKKRISKTGGSVSCRSGVKEMLAKKRSPPFGGRDENVEVCIALGEAKRRRREVDAGRQGVVGEGAVGIKSPFRARHLQAR